jgi:hypothetical protein
VGVLKRREVAEAPEIHRPSEILNPPKPHAANQHPPPVLLGPLRAITYVLMHGMTAAALGTMWVWRWPWAVSVLAGSVLRMAGQMGYLLLSSFTMNENLFAVMVANVHNLMVGSHSGGEEGV